MLRRFRYKQFAVLRFPLFVSFRYSFAYLLQHLTPSIMANFKNEDQQKTSIPTTNACKNFSFRGLRIKKNVVTTFVMLSYFRHSQKHTSQQRQRPIQYAHARDLTMAAAGRAIGPTRAAPGNRKPTYADPNC